MVKVEFFVDGALVGTDTTVPYGMTFDSLLEDDGTHILLARATDTSGQFTNASLTFTLANGQLIRNGSFEKGFGVGWSNTPGVQIGAILGQTAFDGTKLAKLCGRGSTATMGLYQAVTIPARTATATLSYALRIETKESVSGSDRDTLAVQLRSSSGTLLRTLAAYSNRNATPGYQVYSLDVSAHRGQTLQVYFQCTEDSAVATSFLLDKVNLKVTEGDALDTQPPTVDVAAAGNVGTSSPAEFTVGDSGPGNDLIVNGSFENGTSPWSGTARIGTFPTQPAFEGQRCAWLAGQGKSNTADLYQTVAVPGTAAAVTLSYAVHIDTAEKSTWLRYDTAAVQIRDSAGTTLLKTLANYSNLDRNPGYAVTRFDLSAFKGQRIQIYFRSVEDSSYQTSFVFDQVRLLGQ